MVTIHQNISKWKWSQIIFLSLTILTVSCMTPTQKTDSFPTEQANIKTSDKSIDESILENYPYKYSPIQRNGELTDTQIKYQSAHPTNHIGYAGMFSEEDIAGKTIGGYKLELPLMHRPFYSTEMVDYLELALPLEETNSNPLSVQKYNNRLMWELKKGDLPDPYLEYDSDYRSMINNDDNLTVDEKLELIIKSHKGYLNNLDVSNLVQEKIGSITPEEWKDQLVNDIYGGDFGLMLIDMQTTLEFYNKYSETKLKKILINAYVNNVNGLKDYVDKASLLGHDTLLTYENLIMGFDSKTEPKGEEVIIKIAEAYEILKHRLSLISEDFFGVNGTFLTLVDFDATSVASSMSYTLGNKMLWDFSVSYDKFIERDLDSVISTYFHESLHNSLGMQLLSDFNIPRRNYEFQIIEQTGDLDLLTPNYSKYIPYFTVEINNTINQIILYELLNTNPREISTGSLLFYLRKFERENASYEITKLYSIIPLK